MHTRSPCLHSNSEVRHRAFFFKFQKLIRLNSASNYNPLNWLRQKLSADRRERESKEELLAAKQEAREEGQLSLFEQSKSVIPASEDALAKASTKSSKAKKSRKPQPISV
ncbi:hypothetical protein GYMLUDRAFT_815316 [Collybiopsis luxurians FD-317 M1]|nr:hypothetical protein GYMLUDRAFT_815316 [Collybiopsis luxurians FD-317 M1]